MSQPDLTTGWLPLPNGVAADSPAFVITDLHGCSGLLLRALQFAVANADNHEFVFLGDLVDRGPDSLGCARLALLTANTPAFSRVITLMGNHESVLAELIADPKSENHRDNVRMMGGKSLLLHLDTDPDGFRDMSTYVNRLTRHHVNGGLVMTHALPDAGRRLEDQTDADIFWNADDEGYRGGWDRMIGKSAVLVHGHIRNGVPMKDRPVAEVEDDVFKTLSRHFRICCDVGTPWTGEAGLFEFKGDQFRVHGFWA